MPFRICQLENYINWTCKAWTISTDGYNSIHLNDNGVSASCFSQRTLTPVIITTEGVISLLWETYNTQKVSVRAERCKRSSRGIFLGLKQCEVFICKTSLQRSTGRLCFNVKHSPIRASRWSLFNSSLVIRPKPVKRVVASLNSGVFPSFSMRLFSLKVYQWELCGGAHCSQVAWVNSTVQIPHTPALFIWSQKNSTFPPILNFIWQKCYPHPPKHSGQSYSSSHPCLFWVR